MTNVNPYDVPFELRWSRSKGWLRFRDPQAGLWDEVASVDMPVWKRILVHRLRDEGRLGPRREDVADDHDQRFDCGCYPEHEPCHFGLGLDCVNGTACINPHHFGRTYDRKF